MKDKKIVFATNNVGKVEEMQALVRPLGWEIIPQSHFNIPSVEETGLTFIENAILKARQAAKLTGLAAIGDDSGLIVDALNGAPGIYSARYAGDHVEANQHNLKLLNELIDIKVEQRSARFYCALVIMQYPEDPMPIIGQGVWEGKIADIIYSGNGFGYDPVFYLPDQECTVAELSKEKKNSLSHRGKALQDLLKNLECC